MKNSMKKGVKTLAALGLAVTMALTPAIPSHAFFLFDIFKSLISGETEEEEEVKYEFKSGDTVIAMGAEAADILTALGTPASTFEQESCAYQGKDKVYSYAGFELGTYPVDDKECVSSVYILDDTVSTPEGVKIGSTKQEVLDAYGETYDEEEAKFGTYSYKAGTAQLKIYTTDDVVDGIEYLVVPEE